MILYDNGKVSIVDSTPKTKVKAGDIVRLRRKNVEMIGRVVFVGDHGCTVAWYSKSGVWSYNSAVLKKSIVLVKSSSLGPTGAKVPYKDDEIIEAAK